MNFTVKICGLTQAEDAEYCAQAGADWLGFIFHPESPRAVSPKQAAGFETGQARRVGVFVNQSPDEVKRIMRLARLDLAQLHGRQSADFCRIVGPEKVIAVRWPQRYSSPADLAADLEKTAENAAYFLFDAGLQGGGHGQAFDLSILAGLNPPRPWLLAGGLTAQSVESIMESRPPSLIGFDFNSGVEQSPGHKDHELVRSAISAVKQKQGAIPSLNAQKTSR